MLRHTLFIVDKDSFVRRHAYASHIRIRRYFERRMLLLL